MREASDGAVQRPGGSSRRSRKPAGTMTAVGFCVFIPVVVGGLLAARVAGMVPFWVIAAAVPTSTLAYYILLFTVSWTELTPSVTHSAGQGGPPEHPDAEGGASPAPDESSIDADTRRREQPAASATVTHLLAVTVQMIFLSMMFAFGSYVVLRWTVTAFPAVLQFAIFSIASVYTLFLAGALVTSRGRTLVLHDELRRIGPYGIVARVTIYTAIFVNVFGAGTAWLAQRHLIELHDTNHGAVPGVDRVIEFYGWHALDAIPVLEVTKTMNWQVPLTYTGPAAGSLLLLFKVVFLFATLKLVIETVKAVR